MLSSRRGALGACALLALAFVLPALRPGWVLLPLDLLNDLGAWKPDVTARVPVSNRLLSDTVFQQEPWMAFARRTLAEGRMPWVNPHQADGEPFWANPQTVLLSPLTWPVLLLGARGWAWNVFLKLLIAATGGRALALALGARPRAALLSGGVYALCGYTIFWGLHPHPAVSAFLPWLAASLIEAIQRPSPRAVALTVLTAGLATAGGHPETLFHGAAGIGTFLTWELLARRGEGALFPAGGRTLRRAGLAAGAAAAGFLILAAITVPFFLVLQGSPARDQRLSRPAGTFRAAAALAQVLPGFLGSPLRDELDLTALSARAENFNERAGGYVGALTLVALALSFRRLPAALRRGLIVGTAALLLAWEPPLLGRLLHNVPFFGMAANQRLVLVFALFASAAAGPAVEALAEDRPHRLAGFLLFGTGLVLLLAGTAPSVPAARPALAAAARAGIETLRGRGVLKNPAALYEARLDEYLSSGRLTALRRLAWPGVCFAAGGAFLVLSRRRSALFGLAMLGELAGTGWGYLPSVPLSSVPDAPKAVRDMKRLDPASRWWMTAGEGIYPSDLATLHGVRDIRSYDSMGGAHTRALVAAGFDEARGAFPLTLPEEDVRALAARGLRFHLSREPLAGTVRVGGDPPPAVGLYEVPGATPAPWPENRPPRGLALGSLLSLTGLLAALLLARAAGRTATLP